MIISVGHSSSKTGGSKSTAAGEASRGNPPEVMKTRNVEISHQPNQHQVAMKMQVSETSVEAPKIRENQMGREL